jgi:cytochrome P450
MMTRFPGTHACPAQDFARLVLKVITVIVYSSFDLDLLDVDDRIILSVPEVERRLFGISRPAESVKFFLQSKRFVQ